MTSRAVGIVVLLVGTLAGCQRQTSTQVVLVTTTSVGNAGLLDVVVPRYESGRGVRLAVHLAGSGRALKMLESGDADVAISHAPEAEAAALRNHPDWWYRKIMFNDFLIVGPPADPANARGAASLDEALRRLVDSEATFVSRGDESGTHEREKALWSAVGAEPGNLIPTGQGMATTLRTASEQEAYTLTDRATWTRFADSLHLVPVSEGDPRLLNTYAVVVGSTDRRDEGMLFAQWLADGQGRALVPTVPGFTVWPAAAPRQRPDDVPTGGRSPKS